MSDHKSIYYVSSERLPLLRTPLSEALFSGETRIKIVNLSSAKMYVHLLGHFYKMYV